MGGTADVLQFTYMYIYTVTWACILNAIVSRYWPHCVQRNSLAHGGMKDENILVCGIVVCSLAASGIAAYSAAKGCDLRCPSHCVLGNSLACEGVKDEKK